MIGMLIFGFVASQSLANVDRILSSPPGPVAKDIEDLGSDITRLLLKYQAAELNRFLFEAWGVAQIGLGAAILSAMVFTAHRNKFLIGIALFMVVTSLFQVAYIRPSMNALGRAFDFLPLTAATRERDIFDSYHVMYIVAEVIKLLAGLLLTGRLLFDRYGWKQKLMPDPPKRMQRRRKSSIGGDASGTDGPVDRPVKAVLAKIETVDDPNNGHIDG
jgi:hypothetical protein